MNTKRPRKHSRSATAFFAGVVLAMLAQAVPRAMAQNPQVQERVAEIKANMAANKQSLAQYQWQEQQTISIKGEVKKQQAFLVRLGPDGKPQKTPLTSAPPPSDSGGGRLKHRIVEKKKEEFEDYAQQVAALAHEYTQPNPELLQQAYQQGNVSLASAGMPGEVKLTISNYIKPKDSVVMVFDQAQKAIQSITISSYLSDPKDAVTISSQFAKLPDGTNHVASTTVNGESKHLTVQTQNSNYQKM